MSYPINWDMDSIFNGGSDSSELRNKIESMKEEIEQAHIIIIIAFKEEEGKTKN